MTSLPPRRRRRAGARCARSLFRPTSVREEHERVVVAIGAFAENALGDDIGDHGDPAPFLPLLDVGEMHLDDRHREEVERVADRVAVMRPSPRVDDDAARPPARLVAEIDVLTLAVRLEAANVAAELPGPRVDPGLELVVADAPVELGI